MEERPEREETRSRVVEINQMQEEVRAGKLVEVESQNLKMVMG